MPLKILWMLAYRDLGRNRRRSILSLLAVALGLALLITLDLAGIAVGLALGTAGVAYLATTGIPIGDKIELNLGRDPEVIHELIKLRTFRTDLILQINGTSEFRKIGGDGAFKEENATLVGWDDHEILSERIRNYSGKPINVEIRRTIPGHIIFKSSLEPKLHDYQTVELHTTVPASKKADLLFEIVRKQGTSAKQTNITLEKAEVKP